MGASLPGVEYPEPTPERIARRAARRRALLGLVRSVRALITGAVSTNVAPSEVEKIDAEVAGLASRLQTEVHQGPYSGLLGPNALDRYEPSQSVPLSPWAGRPRGSGQRAQVTLFDNPSPIYAGLHEGHRRAHPGQGDVVALVRELGAAA